MGLLVDEFNAVGKIQGGDLSPVGGRCSAQGAAADEPEPYVLAVLPEEVQGIEEDTHSLAWIEAPHVEKPPAVLSSSTGPAGSEESAVNALRNGVYAIVFDPEGPHSFMYLSTAGDHRLRLGEGPGDERAPPRIGSGYLADVVAVYGDDHRAAELTAVLHGR